MAGESKPPPVQLDYRRPPDPTQARAEGSLSEVLWGVVGACICSFLAGFLILAISGTFPFAGTCLAVLFGGWIAEAGCV